MKKHYRSLPICTLGALAAVLLALGWFISYDGPVPVAEHQGNTLTDNRLSGRPAASVEQLPRGADLVASPVPAMEHRPPLPAGVDPFAPALADAELLRTERRMFQAQTWEVDLSKALELRPQERLERRSGLFRLAGGGGLVRLDRVYRLGGARPAAVVKPVVQGVRHTGSPADDATAPDAPSMAAPGTAATVAATVDRAGPLEEGGGKLVWANAMAADRLMVQVESGVTRERLAVALPRMAKVGRQVTAGGLYLVEVPAEGERSVERAVLALNQLKGVVRFAEPDFVLTGADTSANDPLFTTNSADVGKQWHLAKIMTPRAWDVTTGPPFPAAHPQYQPRLGQTVVAVVDTGVDYTHPDLAANIWTNPGESGGGKDTNSLDDDGNGKVDDWRGWSFVENNNNPADDVGHGTHVAGVIGAVGNNATGGSGVCWNVKILPLRIIKAQGTGTYGTYSAAIAALDYIRALNTTGRRVAVANHSWGGNGYSLAMLNVINNPISTDDPLPSGITSTYTTNVNTLTVNGNSTEIAKIRTGMSISGAGIPGFAVVTIVSGSSITISDYTKLAGTNTALTFSNPIRPKPYGVVHVAAAGNSQFNSDRIPIYPACLPSGFIVSVGASDNSDNGAVWTLGAGSNYGKLNVDLFAPGSSIWSTKWKTPADPSYGYESRNGTSMAAPQVAGALALIRMWQPKLTELQARQVLIEQVDQVTGLQAKCVGGGRLNIAKIIDRLYQPILVGSGGGTGGGGTLTEALTGAQAVLGRLATSQMHMLAIVEGEVWAWGRNDFGQLGKGTFTQESAIPAPVAGLDDIVMVSVGAFTSVALKSDGTVWVWGDGSSGMNGNGTLQTSASPVQVSGLTDVTWIASDSTYVLAVKSDGTVWAWGRNAQGQLGDGTTTDRLVPVRVGASIGFDHVVQVDAGADAAIALLSDGTVYCWGRSLLGIASPTPLTSTTPIQVAGISDAIQVQADVDCVIVKADGTVWGWATNNAPAQISELNVPIALATAGYVGSQTHIAITYDGRMLLWGTAGSSGVEEIPQDPNDPYVAAAVSRASILQTSSGVIRTWGDNAYSQLGIGVSQRKQLPVRIRNIQPTLMLAQVSSVPPHYVDEQFQAYEWNKPWGVSSSAPIATGVIKIAPFYQDAHALLALKTDHSVWGKGDNTHGELGNGTTNYSGTLIQVTGMNNVSDIVTGTQFAVALMPDGTLRSWGLNSSGQLGDGTTTDRYLPTIISNLTNVDRISAGKSHVLAVKTDGTVWAWGSNDFGQLGLGIVTTSSSSPQQVIGLNNINYVYATENRSWAVRNDGTVWGFGENYSAYSRLPGTSQDRIFTPTQVLGLPAISSVWGSEYVPFFVAADGGVWTWGSATNNSVLGRLSTDTTPPSTPAPVVGLTNVSQVANTNLTAYALKADGTVWAWGNPGLGGPKIGDGDDSRASPVNVLRLSGTSTTLSTLGTGDNGNSWYLQKFSVPELLNDSLVADNATPAGDGIPNLIKYALGLNPKQRYDSSSLPTARVDLIGGSAQSTSARGGIGLFSMPTVDLTNGKRYLAFTVARNGIHADIDYLVEVSTNLVSWTSGDPYTVTVLDTADTLEVYSAASLDDVPRQFMQLKIQRK